MTIGFHGFFVEVLDAGFEDLLALGQKLSMLAISLEILVWKVLAFFIFLRFCIVWEEIRNATT